MDGKFCSVCLRRKVLNDIHRNDHDNRGLTRTFGCASADVFANWIKELSPMFTIGRQEDPSEFLIFFIDHLIEWLKSDVSFVGHVPSTVIHHIFGLLIQSTSKCRICSGQTVSKNWDSVLSIPVASHSNVTEALDNFFSAEEMNGENLYQCDACRKRVPATKTVQITKASPVVFIHLRRFSHDTVTGLTRKIQRTISYPDLLDLSPYLVEDSGESYQTNHLVNPFSHRLYAVVAHQGTSADSGHIFAYVRSPDGLWYKADDAWITQVRRQQVLDEKDAYILCYAKTPASNGASSSGELLSTQSSPFVISSTPIRPGKFRDGLSNDHSIV